MKDTKTTKIPSRINRQPIWLISIKEDEFIAKNTKIMKNIRKIVKKQIFSKVQIFTIQKRTTKSGKNICKIPDKRITTIISN